ncbi:MAG: hypothetical protein COV66_15520 [Nitrospinae bacterium CG11_big_fil_rev_8_21_14_0_20_45_15]|nr:MAG: hypothetical protein COV66_15520 [Nitrospinae bacterium CG11_big_fil_rev_8_21_14_0_20_45_15]
MLIFAKAIDQRPESIIYENIPTEQRERETYYRQLFPYTIVRAGLDLSYKELDDILDYVENDFQPPADSSRQEYPSDIDAWYHSRFPWTANFLDKESTHFALVLLVKSMDSFGSYETMNEIHSMIIYDCVESIVSLYNKLLKEAPEKARDITLSKGVPVDFDDFINQYWPNIDFALMSKADYPHKTHSERKEKIEAFMDGLLMDGTEPLQAIDSTVNEFDLSPAVKVLLRRDEISRKLLELQRKV